MEVTSIAIDQERTAACAFDTVVFSNLTQDHLDYHGNMQAYILSKERLFTEYVRKYAKPHCAAAIISTILLVSITCRSAKRPADVP